MADTTESLQKALNYKADQRVKADIKNALIPIESLLNKGAGDHDKPERTHSEVVAILKELDI